MKQLIAGLLETAVASLRADGKLDKEESVKIAVDATKDKSHGDFATNLAMMICKKLSMKPRDAAELILSKIPEDAAVSKIEIAGPGFLNFYLAGDALSAQIDKIAADARLGVPLESDCKTVVVDYSSPNVAKEMAVHHIRSTVIGDACVRVLEFLGNKVIRANHVGDWGTQFGMLIAYLERMEQQNAGNLEVRDLEAFYRSAKVLYDEDEAFAEKARGYVVKLQGGDEYCRQMWRKLVDMTMALNQRIYDRLNVSLTPNDVMGESLYNDMLPVIAKELEEKGLAKEDQGALVVYLDEFKNKDGDPMGVIVRKTGGGYLYATTDIACAKYRVENLGAKRVLYFIDSRQHDHLMQAWAIARKAGYVPEDVSLEHCSFGMMLGKDGKPFKTRSGGTVKLSDLLDEAESRVGALMESRSLDLTGEERAKAIHEIAMGAVKYADLSKNRVTDYVFDWDSMLSFDGNTAPYLQYAYTRIASVFRKAGAACDAEWSAMCGKACITAQQEEKLALKLISFAETVSQVSAKASPHILCSWLYELAGLFMSFYEACPINKEGVEAEDRASRLTLCLATAKALKLGLSLLGINTLERM